jgi:ATP dependent DNA ligase-like protein
MECLAVSKLDDGPQRVYELKLDGYRAIGVKSDRGVRLLSRRSNSFSRQYPQIMQARADRILEACCTRTNSAKLLRSYERRRWLASPFDEDFTRSITSRFELSFRSS